MYIRPLDNVIKPDKQSPGSGYIDILVFPRGKGQPLPLEAQQQDQAITGEELKDADCAILVELKYKPLQYLQSEEQQLMVKNGPKIRPSVVRKSYGKATYQMITMADTSVHQLTFPSPEWKDKKKPIRIWKWKDESMDQAKCYARALREKKPIPVCIAVLLGYGPKVELITDKLM